ncbi:MAG: ECF transporter S component, partial [Clostridia bacterium]|nr:ECF transporter S component [Clostridia bacterium]
MERKLDKKTHRLALAGQLCGATLLLTLISLPLPSGYGYVNLGDAGVFLCACLLPGGLGALAAGVGAALADLILGW